MKRLLFIAGIALGYVLGARAGRSSYERIRTRAQGVWSDPKVQKGLHDAEGFVKDKAPVVASKVKDAATSAAGAVQSKVKSSGDTDADASSTDTVAGGPGTAGPSAAGKPEAPSAATSSETDTTGTAGTPSPDAV
ncbi:YtxH domain-containing protein [Curtobacterium sp. MCBD17_019]|uniref:YtxH domain-containing protein n=1 Tax=Curtobacterium sp. MCBD17_019 TaxID=2175669 RepID=UPI000DA9EC0B|nr:YtxH domain-containing protein [Curtobacterium sp. MCBD17_019]PZE78260.1 YtxH domain-containing protein [Curtobacterium sp. MCBD17_019]